ncbi:PAS domain S-box protein [Thermoflavifilum thermophilum]|uniref:histidine kinase n=1 Tax=Thermoflavifilum thermophilum TaxID=1393122 RepID=A0A1I7NCD5_9BACT|nr:PAS domain S-box protein [Thermoflavifilum thermophilum]SFV32322.1 PAS domain S-box-containing protein [Thermoflavifilum thermophilum]
MSFTKRISVFIILALGLFLYFSISALIYYRQFEGERKQVQHSYQVLSHTQQLRDLFEQNLFSTRSLAGNWRNKVMDQLLALQKLVVDNPVQSKRVDSLIATFSTYGVASAFRSTSAAVPQSGWLLTLRNIERDENQLLFLRDQSYQHISRRLLAYTLIACISFLLFVVAGLWQLKQDEAKRRKAEQEALANEARYRKLIEGVRVVVFTTDLDGRFSFISRRVQQLTGYKPEELLGRSYKTLVHPDWHERVTQFYLRQLDNKLADTSLDFPIVTKDGKEKWIRMYSTLLLENEEPVGLQCVVLDTSERKEMLMRLRQAERQRRENQHLLEALMDNTASLIFIKDLQHRYQFVNKAFKQTLQLTGEQVYGKTDFEITTPELAQRYHESDDRIYQGASIDKTEEIIYVNNEPHHFLITKFPLRDEQQRIFGLCGIATDITDLIQYQQQLVEAKQRAEDAEKFQEQFLTTISHEMRTPLQGIVGMTYLLSSSSLTAEQQEFLRSIQEAADTLLTLINDLLDLSKIKAGKLVIEKLPFSLKEILQSLDHLFHFRAQEKKLSFDIVCAPDVPDRLIGDPHRLKQILVNLVGNAMKFTETGFIRVDVKALPGETKDSVMLQFAVADSGIGIPADRIQQIFESFTQAEAAISRKYGGSGLGLSITQYLVKLQGGHIEVESEPGKGSVFTVSIPYQHDPAGESQPRQQISQPMLALRGLRVLVGEDNYVNQKFISRLLHRLGAEVDVVDNGREVIHKLEQRTDYDLLLIDMRMPVVNGYQAIRHIRKEMHLNLPIIAMTAAVLSDEEERSYQEGANACIRKPFTPQDILKVIYQLLPAQHLENAHKDALVQTPDSKHVEPAVNGQKGYDLSTILELDDDQYTLEVLDLFLKTAPETLDQIEQAYKNKDFRQVREKAHRLKSSLGLLNMHTLLAIMKNIEQQAAQEKDDHIFEDILRAKSILQQYMEPLRQEADGLRNQLYSSSEGNPGLS